MDDTLIREVIERCRLVMDIEDGRKIAKAATSSITNLDTEERNAALLLLERYVLNSQGGHKVTVAFGHSNAANNPRCIVCRRSVDQTDWSLRITSRWEVTLLWVTWHDACLENAELEFDYDLLNGEIVSPIGFV
jgi:hypothetical protein